MTTRTEMLKAIAAHESRPGRAWGIFLEGRTVEEQYAYLQTKLAEQAAESARIKARLMAWAQNY